MFNGDYVTGNIDENYLAHLEALRNDASKNKEMNSHDNGDGAFVGLHNDFD